MISALFKAKFRQNNLGEDDISVLWVCSSYELTDDAAAGG